MGLAHSHCSVLSFAVWSCVLLASLKLAHDVAILYVGPIILPLACVQLAKLDSKFAMSSSVLVETPEKTTASAAGVRASSSVKASVQLQSENAENGGAQSAELDSSDDDDGLPCVHEGRCKGGCSCGGFSQRNTFTLKGILKELAIADVQALKRKRVS